MASAGFYNWSITASINGNADASINLVSGISPSSVAPSSRAVMARLREWGNDISGSIVSTGTSTAYAIATGQNFDTLAHLHGQMVAFVPHATNGATVTLNVDGLGAKPLRSSPGVEIGAGVLVQGTPYVLTYNNSDGAFYLQNFFGSSFVVPIGTLLPSIMPTVPNSNFVFPFGQAISRTTYSTLFAAIGTSFGAGDGISTFNIVDLRGRFIAGQDNMGGSAAGRITVAGGNFDGTLRGGTGGAENQTLTAAQLPVITPTGTIVGQGSTLPTSGGLSTAGTTGNPLSVFIPSALGNFSFAGNSFGGGGAHPIVPPAMTLPYILRVI